MERTVTEVYCHFIGEAEREAMKVFEKAGEKSPTNPVQGKKAVTRK